MLPGSTACGCKLAEHVVLCVPQHGLCRWETCGCMRLVKLLKRVCWVWGIVAGGVVLLCAVQCVFVLLFVSNKCGSFVA